MGYIVETDYLGIGCGVFYFGCTYVKLVLPLIKVIDGVYHFFYTLKW